MPTGMLQTARRELPVSEPLLQRPLLVESSYAGRLNILKLPMPAVQKRRAARDLDPACIQATKSIGLLHSFAGAGGGEIIALHPNDARVVRPESDSPTC